MEDCKSYSGRYGDIWEYSPGVWWAIELTVAGNEVLRRGIPTSKLSSWKKRLGVPSLESAQRLFASSFPGSKEEVQARFGSAK